MDGLRPESIRAPAHGRPMPYRGCILILRMSIAACSLVALILVGGAFGIGSTDAREPLGLPFESGETWQVIRGYRCDTPNCDTHQSGGLNEFAIDIGRTNCGGCPTAGEVVLAAFQGNTGRAVDFATGCLLRLDGDDGSTPL